MVMASKEFEKFLNTSEEWILTRTGIKQRYLVPPDKDIPASELGSVAARNALQKASLRPEDVDGIIVATFTPDSFFPSTACRIQALLGCKKTFAFDISAACSGFVYALSIANGMILSGQCKTLLVVGTEIISKTLDWTDRTTCILFGDGAGAVVLQGCNDKEWGILSTHLESDGSLGDILTLPAWGEKRFMSMRGNEVFKHAVRLMTEASRCVMKSSGLTIDQIDMIIPHQANIRIINAIAEQLNLPQEKIIANLDRYGNTSSASIPLALEEVWDQGKIKDGTRVILTSLGGGITIGSAAIRF